MIDKRIIEEVLTEQKEELAGLNSKQFISRIEESQVDFDSELAQVVIGVRRSGKSTLCYNVLKKKGVNFAYVNFDDERLEKISNNDLNSILEILYKIYGNFKYLFIDEIQNIGTWYLFVNRLLRQGLHIIVSGSNAKLLSGELATHLTGRYHKVELYPFSFEEYCNFKDVNTTKLTTKAEGFRRNAFDEYLRQGGFPALMHEKNATNYIDSLLQSIIKQDIEQRYRIRYAATFEKLASHLLDNAPYIINDAELTKLFKVSSSHTIENYINYLKQAYLLISIHKYSTKSKLRIRDEKIYPVDIAFLNQRVDAFVGKNLGWRLECIVLIELIRRFHPLQYDIYYYKTPQSETDFLVCKGNKVLQAIQVSYDISDAKTYKREISGLITAAKSTKCKDLLLITDHERQDVKKDGFNIKIRPAYEWTLQTSDNE